jgi:hypothetical protein
MADHETRTIREINYINEGEELPTTYANNVDLRVSNWDVQLRFGQIQGVDENTLHVRNVMSVYMSRDHVRVFIESLKQNLDKWDAVHAQAQEK